MTKLESLVAQETAAYIPPSDSGHNLTMRAPRTSLGPPPGIPWRMIGAVVGLVAALILIIALVAWLKGPSELSRPVIDDQGNLIQR